MRIPTLFLFAVILALSPVRLPGDTDAAAPNWQNSVVALDIRRKQYDYLQPWATPMQNVQKAGVVIAPGEILTTAENLADTTLIRVQKHGRGQWYPGEVKWIDYHANLAIVTTRDEAFWETITPAALDNPISQNGVFQVVRWRGGRLETRRADFNQFTVEESPLSYASYLHMELNSEINDVGRAEAVISDNRLAGLVIAQSGNTCRVIPSCFIASVLEARKSGEYRGLGWFEFVWQPAENPKLHRFLGYEGKPRGVVVVKAPGQNGNPPLKRQDLIVQIDGLEIDTTGDYKDPVYGHLSLENLATRERWAGDAVELTVWRDGELIEVRYEIPKVEFAAKVVPFANFDERPEYLMAGGLVFQPLSNSYLRSWGADWRRRAPFRLFHFNNEEPTAERPSRVVLSQVLPDPVNLGYQEQRNLVVDRVNGQIVSTLHCLRRALQAPVDGFHVIEFLESTTLRRMVLDAAQNEQATERILARYGIDRAYVINSSDPARQVAEN